MKLKFISYQKKKKKLKFIINFCKASYLYPPIPIKQKKVYVHNIFTILSQQILSGRLLLIVMDRQKKKKLIMNLN